MRFDLLLRGGTLVTPSGVATGDVGILHGRIADLGALDGADAEQVVDCRGLHVLPGLVDSQVHFREPGLEHKEDLGTGTAAAALGGITAIFEMPNTKPNTDTAERLADKVRRGEEKAWVDFAFFVGATGENAAHLGELERLPGCAGVKVFMGSSTGSLLVEDDAMLAEVLAHGTRRVAIHAEDEMRLRERKHVVEGENASPHLHPVWRDEETAIRATQRVLRLARRTGRRIHVLHVTTAEEAELLARHKDVATMEVLPQHLVLHAPDCYDRLGTYAQMNPPIRGERHQRALWEAIRRGVVDVLGSDHAPHTREEKDAGYPKSPSGLPGVQTMVPLMLNAVNEGRLSLERLVDLLAHGPQRIYGIARKGRLTVGYDADLTIVDLGREHVITHEEQASRVGWTPFAGWKLKGWPVRTIVRGRSVMIDGQLQGAPSGRAVRFVETLAPQDETL
ncbi:MAG: dihydroorotase [Myxococcota bacterium]|jgi:dihydroorotase|nr:dihydroorotase [Myxococcota bacterium]